MSQKLTPLSYRKQIRVAKMRILFVGMYPDPVSPYRNVFFQNLIHAMADAGVECTVISPVPVTKYGAKIRKVPHKTEDFTEKKNRIQVFYPRYGSYSSRKIGKLHTGRWSERSFQNSALRQARRLSSGFDLVYGHFLLSGGLAATRIARELSLPAFFAYGECDYVSEVTRHYGNIRPEELEGLRGIIAVSTNNARTLQSKTLFQKYPILVAPNAVDMKLFRPMDKAECRAILGLPMDRFIVGFVGGFIERKGDRRLLSAINSLEHVYGAFAGRGDCPPEGERVLFCRALEHREIPLLLNAVDVFCLPTRNEGSCNAIVEAAACGVPIISSDLPFNDDLLTTQNSIRIDPDSVEEIQRAIQLLFSNAELRQSIATRVYQDAQAFSIEERCKKILLFLQNTLDQGADCHS